MCVFIFVTELSGDQSDLEITEIHLLLIIWELGLKACATVPSYLNLTHTEKH